MNDKIKVTDGKIYLASVRQEGKNGCYISLGVTQENNFYAVDYESLKLRGDWAEIGGNGATIIKEMDEREIVRFQKYSRVKAEGMAKNIDSFANKYFFETYLKSRRSSENAKITETEKALLAMHNLEIDKATRESKENLLEFADFEGYTTNKRNAKKQNANRLAEEMEK